LSETAYAKTAEVALSERSGAETFSGERTSIRVSPNDYFIALFPATFFSGFLVYLEKDWAAGGLFLAAWTIFPILYWNDRIEFNGKRLNRTGILPRFWASLNAERSSLKISDVEQIETQALRALKRGGNVFYRYRTTVRGKGVRFAFASGGEDYRLMIRRVFPLVSENVLDNRSIELRDYLAEPKETLMKAEFEHIPSAEVLENSLGENGFRRTKRASKKVSAEEIEKADYLHRLANELRLSGYLLQSLEAFRRALLLNPKNARLLFDFARCLNSFAGSEHSERLQKKSIAALRLAEKRAGGDGELLARLGESYFQFGDYRRAKAVFAKALEQAEKNFRSVRGLAEIALREGKIAYVIHHFSAANRFAETASLRRWTRDESEYFSRLNDDEDYMEMEISRVNLLETLENAQKTTLRIALFGFPLILTGLILEENLLTNVGWTISSMAMLAWLGVIMSVNIFAGRIPYELIEEED
jgi:tetratricopeptide (TPR) repeat protein